MGAFIYLLGSVISFILAYRGFRGIDVGVVNNDTLVSSIAFFILSWIGVVVMVAVEVHERFEMDSWLEKTYGFLDKIFYVKKED